uniref:Uncharacterized protein n=1 Tax=Vespula pensylvanica TaxID=30213 RepID=A0A834P0V2_VESPE|nr:hypothetical protein H0235_008891 [Vespula pensylvanica]
MKNHSKFEDHSRVGCSSKSKYERIFRFQTRSEKSQFTAVNQIRLGSMTSARTTHCRRRGSPKEKEKEKEKEDEDEDEDEEEEEDEPKVETEEAATKLNLGSGLCLDSSLVV